MATPSTASQGYATKLAVKEHADQTNPVAESDWTNTTGNAERLEFQSATLSKRWEWVESNGIRGTRTRHNAVVRQGIFNVGGVIELIPTKPDHDILLPWILGTNESTDVFDVANTLQTFAVLIDKVGDIFQYVACWVNRATWRCRTGEMLALSLDILAQSEDTTTQTTFPADTDPALGTGAGNAPFMFHDAVLNLRGDGGGEEAWEMFDCEISVDNALDARFANSQTATSITPQDRIVTVRCTVPSDSVLVEDLYDVVASGAGGNIHFTNGIYSTKFEFGTLQFAGEPLEIPGKSEIPLTLNMQARQDATNTFDIKVTNEEVP